MKQQLRFLLIAVSIAILASGTVAQVAGDYGSAGTGPANWSAPGSWLIFVSDPAWADATPASNAPTSTDNVFVRSLHTITLDAGGLVCKNLTINGTLNTRTSAVPFSTGDLTNASPVITNVASTSGIAAGDRIMATVTGIPSSATVSSVTENTITLSANATATVTGASLVKVYWGGITGTVTSGSPIITGVTRFPSGMAIGDAISGTGLAASSSIIAYDEVAQTITLNKNPTASATVALTIYNNISGVDLTVNGDILSVTNFRVIANVHGVASGNGGLAHTLTLKGNLTKTGGTLGFRTTSAGSTGSYINLTLAGNTNSTLSFNNWNGSQLNYVTINKTGGAKVICTSDIVVATGSSSAPEITNTGINFISGIVETQGTGTFGSANPALGRIKNASSSSYVNGCFTLGSPATQTTLDYPVGDANGYRPISVRSGGVTANACVKVKCISGNANTGSSILSADINKVSSIRFYEIKYTTSSSDNVIWGGTASASQTFDIFGLNYGTDDGVNKENEDLRVAYSTDARANWTGITAAHTSTNGSPLTLITPDALVTPVTLTAASTNTMYVALARATGTTTNPLPVELTSFAGKGSQRSVELKWSTATEVDNYGFEVERKAMNNEQLTMDNWSKVGFVQGSGTSNSPKEYSFRENVVSGKYSYRLKQIDRNGSFTYVGTVEMIEVGAVPKILTLSANFPNPFNPTTNIEFTVPNDGFASLKVYNAIGQEVALLFNGNTQAGRIITTQFNAAQLPSGIYFSKLQFGDNNIVKRMLLVK